MADEIMPHVTEATHRKRVLYIDNIRGDRHTDELVWVADPDDGEDMLRLSEAQARNLVEQLENHFASWDTER